MAKECKRWISMLLVAAMLFFMVGPNLLTAEAEGSTTYTFQAEDYYSGTIVQEAAADMQPGETIDFEMGADFVAGTYTLAVYSCGSRLSFEVLVNGVSVGSIARSETGYGFDVMTLDALSAELELEAGDTITISAPNDGTYGWVDYMQLTEVEQTSGLTGSATETGEGYFIYQTEYYYSGTISEGVAADMQPGETITIALSTNSDFAAGTYTLSINSCGTRTSFEILVNGVSAGTISRAATGYGVDQMTLDTMSTELELEAGDTITISAPNDGTYGWVDYLKLTAVETSGTTGSATETGEGYFIYQTEYYYSGTISEGVAADMQPGETITIALNTNADFAAGTYTLSINSCGNRESFEILVNGISVGTITRSGTDFGQDQMTLDALSVNLELEADDTITIVAPSGEYYGWVDYLKLTAVDESGGETGGETGSETEVPEEATETGEGYFLYQTEYYYSGTISEGVAADMQPGETITIALNTNSDFAAGTYTLSINSCGNRESFEILVNGVSVGTISRSGTDFGQDQMTLDALSVNLELEADDTITVVAPSGEYYGWVDYLKLTAVDESDGETGGETGDENTELAEEATETGDGYYIYQIEYYYDGGISEEVAADMQPGETISVKLSTNSDFVAGTYTLSVYSCGNRESFEILVNGVSVGTITRTGTGFGQDQMTLDTLSTELTLAPGDIVSIVAPDGSYWGWVDYMKLKSTTAADVEEDLGENDSDDGTEAYESYLIYQAEYYYSGSIVEGVAADLQPGESLSINVSSNSGFTAGTYTLTVYSCGNRESFEVLVNGVSAGTITRTGTGFGQDQMTYDKLMSQTLTLNDGDVITLVAPGGEYWGWVDFIILDWGDTRSSGTGTTATTTDTLTSPMTETYDDYYIYHAEYFYDQVAEGQAADLQPGESITINLDANSDFVAGTYVLTVRSCGNRESFEVLVNGVSVGTITRTGTGFGMDQMTDDRLGITLDLAPGDTITIVGQSGEYWGWVDYIKLSSGDSSVPEGEATEAGDGYYIYQAEFYYDQVVESQAADLQPGDTIDIPLNSCEEFEGGWYTITVASCGTRETIYLRLNGTTIGSISRVATDYGMEEMTENRYSVKIELSEDDVLTLSAPNDGTYGWVDYVRLDFLAASEEEEADAADIGAAENVLTVTEDSSGSISGGAIALAAGAGVAAVGGGAGYTVFRIRRKKK